VGVIYQGLHQVRRIKNQRVKEIVGVLVRKLSEKVQKGRSKHCEGRTGDVAPNAGRGNHDHDDELCS
jgi:hypothetical protein